MTFCNRNKRLSLVLLIILFFPLNINGQDHFSTNEIFNKSYFKFFIKRINIKPSSDEFYGGFTANFSWDRKNYKKGETRFIWEQNLFSDVIAGITKKHILKKPITKSGLDHSFSSGFFGSFQYGINAVTREKFIITPAVSFGDYIVAVQSFEDVSQIPNLQIYSNPGMVVRDPAGYFFVAGPSVISSFYINASNWLDVMIAYDFTAYNAGEKNIINFIHIDDYPHPHFLTISVNANHKSGFYTGIKTNRLVNRGSTNIGITRIDINIGYNL
jgi:hypothetical protein